MSKRRILIIDDEVSFTKLIKLNLEVTGSYEVHEVNSGRAGITAAKEIRPDLILLDVIMPDMEGIKVASEIKSDDAIKDTPIVFLTALASKKNEDGSKSMTAGYPILDKPVDIQTVISCIEEQLTQDESS